MGYIHKSWKEKLNVDKVAEVKRIEDAFADVPAGSNMLIATPLIVDAYIKNIPEGTSTTLQQMRKDLAAEYNADYTCPITAGIFLRIVAEAAYEAHEKGATIQEITPFWRIIDDKTPTGKKLSFGTAFVKKMRYEERLPA